MLRALRRAVEQLQGERARATSADADGDEAPSAAPGAMRGASSAASASSATSAPGITKNQGNSSKLGSATIAS